MTPTFVTVFMIYYFVFFFMQGQDRRLQNIFNPVIDCIDSIQPSKGPSLINKV